VAVPVIGAMAVAGMSEGQAEAAVIKAYREKGLFRQPVVALRVVEWAGRAEVKLGPVGKGDLVRVSIVDLSSGTGWGPVNVRVGQDGALPLPLVAVMVDGLGEAQAAVAVEKAYRDAGLIRTAIVALRRVQAAEGADVKLGAIEAGDILRVAVWELNGPHATGPTLKTLKVDEQGEVTPPMLKGVKVAGLSEAEAGRAMQKAYREQGVLPAAQLTVLKVSAEGAWADEELVPAARPPSRKAETKNARR
jgi:protein involved in polysaccharide export with SLBB domain